MSKLTKKERLLHSLIGIKQLFNDLGAENLKNEIVLKDGTTETIDCYKEIEAFVVDFINNEVDEATPKNPILVTHGKVKMTAKDMFEELGFEYKKYNEDFAYEYIENGKTNFVHFITERQTYCTNVYHVSLQLHNAITAQMKELELI